MKGCKNEDEAPCPGHHQPAPDPLGAGSLHPQPDQLHGPPVDGSLAFLGDTLGTFPPSSRPFLAHSGPSSSTRDLSSVFVSGSLHVSVTSAAGRASPSRDRQRRNNAGPLNLGDQRNGAGFSFSRPGLIPRVATRGGMATDQMRRISPVQSCRDALRGHEP